MNTKQYYLFILVVGLVVCNSVMAQEKLNMNWSVIAQMPVVAGMKEQTGVAGAFAGIHHNVLIIAGGANFPDAMPWNGGKKKYHDDIYVLAKNDSNQYDWVKTENLTLPHSVAYGASISTPKGIVCIGGENEQGSLQTVWLLQWNEIEKRVVITNLPDIPIALSNTAASCNNAVLYVAGGENAGGSSSAFFSIDLNNTSDGWKTLPALPSPLSHAVSVVQSNVQHKAVYIMGGRQKKANGISDLFQSVYAFDIDQHKWSVQSSLPYALSAGTGAAYAEHQILLFGGDKGATFHQTELLLGEIATTTDEKKKQKLVEEKNRLQESHPGFSNAILLYNTLDDSWKQVGEIPFTTPVTTTVIKCDNRFFIPSGEIKAGVRTPNVFLGIIRSKNK